MAGFEFERFASILAGLAIMVLFHGVRNVLFIDRIGRRLQVMEPVLEPLGTRSCPGTRYGCPSIEKAS